MAPIANPVARLSREDRRRRLDASFAKGDRVRQDRRNPEVWLVSSSTYPNVWYRCDEITCGCAWFRQRHSPCRHMVRVSWEKHRLRRQQKAA